jgi:hypothetical protein
MALAVWESVRSLTPTSSSKSICFSFVLTNHSSCRRFNSMHLVTSSIFLPSLCARLTEQSQSLFLRSYFLVCLSLYVWRGRPALDIARFFANDTTLHPADDSTPHAEGLASSSPSGVTPNPWLSVIQTSLVHPDEHVPKLQRALCYLAELFGGTPAGYFKNTELKDAEVIDGTLFVRTANLSAKRTGRGNGEVPSRDVWDFTSQRHDSPIP